MNDIAFIAIIISAVFHASWNLVTKQVAKQTGVYILGITIAGVSAVLTLLIAPVDKTFAPEALPYFFLTGLFHVIYFTCLVKAYRFGDFSSAYPLARGLGVMGTSVFAITVLHEHVTIAGIAGILVIFVGILLLGLSSNSKSVVTIKSYLYAIGVGLAVVGYSIVDKQGVNYISPVWQSVGVFTLPVLLLLPYAFLRHRKNLNEAVRKHKFKSSVIGLGSFITYLTVLVVFTYSKVSYVVAAREFAVAIGAIFGYIFLKESFNRKKVWGICLITLGLIMIKIG